MCMNGEKGLSKWRFPKQNFFLKAVVEQALSLNIIFLVS